MTDQPAANGFLPDFCNIRVTFLVVITAEMLAVTLALGSVQPLADFWDNLSLRSLYVQWIALTSTGLVCLLRGPLNRLSAAMAGVAAWGILLLVTAVVAELAFRFASGPDRLPHFDWLVVCLGISAIVGAVVLRYLYVQYLRRCQAAAESQARFQALQSRIRPHFLFNSMNTIANLTRADPALAEEVVQDLADLFRASLSDARRSSTLEEELELARGYLRIEAQRLGERLQVEWDLHDLPGEAPLPTLILQPLLENAVYHGIEPAERGGVIRVSGRYRRGMVNLSIHNSLPPATADKHREGNRMALENTRQRLAGFFTEGASMNQARVDGGYQVRIAFPYPGERP